MGYQDHGVILESTIRSFAAEQFSICITSCRLGSPKTNHKEHLLGPIGSSMLNKTVPLIQASSTLQNLVGQSTSEDSPA